MNVLRKSLPDHLRFLVWVQLILLAIYSLFRYVTLVANRPTYSFSSENSLSVWEAFKVGFRFDVLVTSYALLIPYLALTGAFIFNFESSRLFKWVRMYCTVAILLSLVICAIDIPYFKFFNSHLTTSAINWGNMGQSTKYMLSEIKYYPVILVALFGIWGVGKLVVKLWDRSSTGSSHNFPKKIGSTSVATILLMLGLWGGATPQKPTMDSAYVSNDGFINQLTINPVHAWFDSYFDFDVNVFTSEEAIQRVRKYLGIKSQGYDSPLAKERNYPKKAKNMNVVLVLMESMSAAQMGVFGDPRNLTPGLDSIAKNSVLFKNCYSNGIHTNAGIYASLYGMPIKMMQHPMKNGISEHIDYTGLPVTLKNKGYETIFFCTHPKSFDNLNVFLEKNGFDFVSDQFDYPDTAVANAWGVGDETLFGFAHQRLNQMADSTKPFFATILTITAHPPYTLPGFTAFRTTKTDPVEITYQYADWAIKSFMDSVSKEPWYDNTVFVFVGDHGLNNHGPYEVPLSYNHVPLIIHAPALFNKPKVMEGMANQTDIYPTVMGLLQQDYVQNTMGYDLFKEKRPFSIFSQDLKMCAINDKYLFIARKSGRKTLYEYQTAYGQDILNNHAIMADSMENFACAQIQLAQELIINKKLGPQKK